MVFVIDGTQSMQPFFKGVSDGIIASMKELSLDNKNHFKFSVLIYRDMEDKQDVYEYFPLRQTHYNSASAWVNARKASSTKDDPDMTEAMYYGIQTAIRRTAPPEKETNVLVLVGDAGDNGRGGDGKPVKLQKKYWTCYTSTNSISSLSR